MSRYKNISQRAGRYARGKTNTNVTLPYTVNGTLAMGFRDGYRLAMKEIRAILDDSEGGMFEALGGVTERIEKFVNDSERLK